MISTLTLPSRSRRDGKRIDWGQTGRELVEGLRFLRRTEAVRSVMLGMGVGLIGCGAVVPLAPIYVKEVLGSGPAGFGLLMTGLGTGAALGVLALSVAARRLPTEPVFVAALFGSGIGLVLATAVPSLTLAVVLTGVFGLFAGTGYVSGFTIIQERVGRLPAGPHVRHAVHDHPVLPAAVAGRVALDGQPPRQRSPGRCSTTG